MSQDFFVPTVGADAKSGVMMPKTVRHDAYHAGPSQKFKVYAARNIGTSPDAAYPGTVGLAETDRGIRMLRRT